ncbi:MAG: cupin domain-containing protein [Bacillota bacterium]
MYVAKEDMTTYTRERIRDGNGTIKLLRMFPEEEQPAKCRLYSILTLEKGCSIGWHTHDDETEIYYILRGEAVTDDNGTIRTLRPGDVTVTGKGAGHWIENRCDEPMEMFVVVIKD